MIVATRRLATRLLAGALLVAGVACNVVAGLDDLTFVDGDCVQPCDDGDPCTQSDCAVSGVCRGKPTPERGACATADFMGVCVQGTCLPTCGSDAACDDMNPCTADTCDPTSQMCVHQAVDGMPTPPLPQVQGDCHTVLCVGGERMNKVDDTDVPDAANPCVQHICTDGVGSTPFLPNQPCGEGKFCNSTGMCGCTSDPDCKSPDSCGGGNPGMVGYCGCTKTDCTKTGQTCGPTVPDGCYGTIPCDDGIKNGGETDVDCGGPDTTCSTRCDLGQHCNDGSDCKTGFCSDGVCCDAACSGKCLHCTAMGHCTNVAKNTADNEPLGACVFPHTCDGAGNCKLAANQFCTASYQCVNYCKANACH